MINFSVGVLVIAVFWSLAGYRQSSPVLREYIRSLCGARLDNSLVVVEQINVVDDAGLSPLHHAAIFGDLPLTKFLLANGADPLLKDDNGLRPFDYAERLARLFMLPRQMIIVSYLLEKTWGVNGTDQQGWTALMWAIVGGGHVRVKELLNAGALVVTGRVQNAIDVAVVMKVDDDFVELLVSNSPIDGLSLALDREYFEFANTVIDRYFSDTAPPSKLLTMMIDKGSAEGMKFLISKGIKPNSNSLTNALTHYGDQKLELAQIVIDHGVKPNEHHLQLSLQRELYEFADTIVEKMVANNYFDPSRLLSEVISSRRYIRGEEGLKIALQFLLGYGAVPNKEDIIKVTELKSAKYLADDEELVQMLLDHVSDQSHR